MSIFRRRPHKAPYEEALVAALKRFHEALNDIGEGYYNASAIDELARRRSVLRRLDFDFALARDKD